jgi:hypothetical protein
LALGPADKGYPFDPYKNCESNCSHDTAPGVLVNLLLEKDGPYPGEITDVYVNGTHAVLIENTRRVAR